MEKVYTGPDYLERMIADRAGNVVVIAGNNARKTEYIVRSIDAGLNVLADKPMVRTPDDLVKLRQAFRTAEQKHVLLYDIMTERNEVTTALQRELSHGARAVRHAREGDDEGAGDHEGERPQLLEDRRRLAAQAAAVVLRRAAAG